MSLIAIIVAMAVEMFSSNLAARRAFAWFDGYLGWWRSMWGQTRLWSGSAGPVAALALPVLLLYLVQWWVHDAWLGFFELLLSIGVLIYCLRFQSLENTVDDYSHVAAAGNTARQQELASAIATAAEPADKIEQDPHRAVVGAIFVQANERLFAVLFWFIVLGPVGALLYRLSWLICARFQAEAEGDDAFVDAAWRLQGILAWVPARLAALAYAVAGSFEDALHQWRNYSSAGTDNFVEESYGVLRHAGLGALPEARFTESAADGGAVTLSLDAVQSARDLVVRALGMLGIVLALITLAGWAA